jgi:CRP-like cAMP-binding protein
MEDMNLLRKISFFRELSREELIRLNVVTETAAFNEDAQIMKEGEPCDAIYVIKTGSAKVMKGGVHIETLQAGEPIGEISFFDKGSRSATLLAGKDTALIKIASRTFEVLMQQDRDLAAKIYHAVILVLCRRLRDSSAAMQIVPDFVKNAYRGYDDI